MRNKKAISRTLAVLVLLLAPKTALPAADEIMFRCNSVLQGQYTDGKVIEQIFVVQGESAKFVGTVPIVVGTAARYENAYILNFPKTK